MPDSNDNFASRTVLNPSGGTAAYDLAGSTYEAGDPLEGASGTLWYEFTPSESGDWGFMLDVSLNNRDPDTSIAFFSCTGDPTFANLVFMGLGVQVGLSLDSGQTYFFELFAAGAFGGTPAYGSGVLSYGKLTTTSSTVGMQSDPSAQRDPNLSIVGGASALTDSSDSTYVDVTGTGDTSSLILLTGASYEAQDKLDGDLFFDLSEYKIAHRYKIWNNPSLQAMGRADHPYVFPPVGQSSQLSALDGTNTSDITTATMYDRVATCTVFPTAFMEELAGTKRWRAYYATGDALVALSDVQDGADTTMSPAYSSATDLLAGVRIRLYESSIQLSYRTIHVPVSVVSFTQRLRQIPRPTW